MDHISDYRIAAGTITTFTKDDKEYILLLRRSIHETSFHGLWELPGGKVENDESPAQTALTELYEEAGIKSNDIEKTFLIPHRDHSMDKIYYGFIVHVDDDAVQLSEEHDDYVWVEIADALNMEPLSHHAHFLLSQIHELNLALASQE
jgi:8-oxo-dGTP pyrophosphatase MutT (NUDIX family)